jgi:double-stranded uracil-DNA glycosylase
MRHNGFAPVAGAYSRVLILGTLPGRLSLERGEYYAQPRNAFWRIVGDLVGASPELPYAERLLRLQQKQIALWDVCAAGSRIGSLDSNIRFETVVPNEFNEFFAGHPHICLIVFNGSKAEAIFQRLVLPGLGCLARDICRKGLPSTSPAHAAMPYARKLSHWRAIVDAIGTAGSCTRRRYARDAATIEA